jgi:hypothetical protein
MCLIGVAMLFGFFVIATGCWRNANADAPPLPMTAIHTTGSAPVIAAPTAGSVIYRR